MIRSFSLSVEGIRRSKRYLCGVLRVRGTPFAYFCCEVIIKGDGRGDPIVDLNGELGGLFEVIKLIEGSVFVS